MRAGPLGRWAVPAAFAVAAASTGVHAAGSLGDALTQASSRAWLIAIYGVLRTSVALAFAMFTVGRGASRRPSRNPVAFAACAVAMTAVIVFADPSRSTPEGVVLAGDLVAVAFCVWLSVSVVFLGRCFGVLPEARGLVTTGPYRFIRHPVYLGEIGACVGLTIAAPSPGNGGVLAALIIAQLVRMRLEERALTSAFPRYASYAASTPRLIPRPSLLRAGLRRKATHPPALTLAEPARRA
jgi:protein-S-isoprenylcysteine O-methyltransferase Ste14